MQNWGTRTSNIVNTHSDQVSKQQSKGFLVSAKIVRQINYLMSRHSITAPELAGECGMYLPNLDDYLCMLVVPNQITAERILRVLEETIKNIDAIRIRNKKETLVNKVPIKKKVLKKHYLSMEESNEEFHKRLEKEFLVKMERKAKLEAKRLEKENRIVLTRTAPSCSMRYCPILKKLVRRDESIDF